jgi:hypothetical protein
VPVGSIEIYVASGRCQSPGEFLPALHIIRHPNCVPSGDIAERSHQTDLDKNRSLWISAECHSGFKEDVRPRLGCRLSFWIIRTRFVSRLEVGNLVRSEQDDDCSSVLERRIENLSDIRGALSG